MGDIGQGLHGISASTADHMILDVGALYANISLSALRGAGPNQLTLALASAKLIGATRGGASVNTGKAMRDIEIDGRRFPLKGLVRIDSYDPTLRMTILEQTVSNLKRQLANYDEVAYAGFTEFSPSVTVKAAEYIDNIALVTAINNTTTSLVVVLENALVVEAMEFSFEDKNEIAVETVFKGHADPATPHDSPLLFFYPAGLTS